MFKLLTQITPPSGGRTTELFTHIMSHYCILAAVDAEKVDIFDIDAVKAYLDLHLEKYNEQTDNPKYLEPDTVWGDQDEDEEGNPIPMMRNPEGRWDWWVFGGRWDGYFLNLLHDDPKKGPHFMDKEWRKHYDDIARGVFTGISVPMEEIRALDDDTLSLFKPFRLFLPGLGFVGDCFDPGHPEFGPSFWWTGMSKEEWVTTIRSKYLKKGDIHLIVLDMHS